MSNPKCGICKEYMKHHNSCMRRACHAQFEKDYSVILSMKPSFYYSIDFGTEHDDNFHIMEWKDLSGNGNDMKIVSSYVSPGMLDTEMIPHWEALHLVDIDTYKLGKVDK